MISQSLDEEAGLDNMQTISKEEAAALGVTYTNFIGPNDSTITRNEHNNCDRFIAEDRQSFKDKMKHSFELLYGNQTS